mmetsp:Transcript_24410/g.84851  ORF Transcript_24410/g.84851 Transcript_24410/m.84851 type:complete len:220 (+) Transcript_24410:450-1109(+)
MRARAVQERRPLHRPAQRLPLRVRHRAHGLRGPALQDQPQRLPSEPVLRHGLQGQGAGIHVRVRVPGGDAVRAEWRLLPEGWPHVQPRNAQLHCGQLPGRGGRFGRVRAVRGWFVCQQRLHRWAARVRPVQDVPLGLRPRVLGHCRRGLRARADVRVPPGRAVQLQPRLLPAQQGQLRARHHRLLRLQLRRGHAVLLPGLLQCDGRRRLLPRFVLVRRR